MEAIPRIALIALSLAAVVLLISVLIKLFLPSTINEKVHFEQFNGVECVVYSDGRRGGVSCNWAKYNERAQ